MTEYEAHIGQYKTALAKAEARIAELEQFIANEAMSKSKGGGYYDSIIKVEHSCCCNRYTGGMGGGGSAPGTGGVSNCK